MQGETPDEPENKGGSVFGTDNMLTEENKALEEVAAKFNETPFKALGYDHPREHFAALAT